MKIFSAFAAVIALSTLSIVACAQVQPVIQDVPLPDQALVNQTIGTLINSGAVAFQRNGQFSYLTEELIYPKKNLVREYMIPLTYKDSTLTDQDASFIDKQILTKTVQYVYLKLPKQYRLCNKDDLAKWKSGRHKKFPKTVSYYQFSAPLFSANRLECTISVYYVKSDKEAPTLIDSPFVLRYKGDKWVKID